MDGAAAVSDVLYRYDGSYPGFLCCIFESYAQKELPLAVCGPEEGQTSLYAMREIETDLPRARRVEKGVDRLGGAVRARLMTGFLSGDDGKDLTLLRFARAAFRQGPGAAQMLGDPDVSAAFALERAVNNEACWMREFLRFEQRGPMLGAVIHPRHYVLPLLRAHFCSRLPDENFVILDAAHGAALLRQGADVQYLQMRQFTAAPGRARPNGGRFGSAFSAPSRSRSATTRPARPAIAANGSGAICPRCRALRPICGGRRAEPAAARAARASGPYGKTVRFVVY